MRNCFRKRGLLCPVIFCLMASNARADGLVENPGFDFPLAADGGLPGWGKLPAPYSYRTLEGMNGTKAIHFESSEEREYPRIEQEVKLRPGHRYVHSAMIKIEGFHPYNERGATIGFRYFDANGRGIGGYARDGVRGAHNNGKWVKLGGITRPVPLGTVKAKVGVFVYGKCTGRVWFDDVVVEELEEKPVDRLHSSAYRDLAADGDVTFVATLGILTNETPLATLDATFAYSGADGKTHRVPAQELAADAAKVVIDVSKLAPGESTVGFELRAKGAEKPLGRTGLRFTRAVKMPERAVRIDEHGRTIVRGKPYFPLGGFGGFPGRKDPEAAAKLMADSPFDCVMSYEPLTKGHLDLLERNGLMSIYCIADLWAGDGLKGIKTVEDEERIVRERIAAVKDHPALLAWYVNDERPATMRDKLIRRQELVAGLDPDHPTWAVLYQVDDMRAYLPTADVVGSDPYPVPLYDLNSAYSSVRKTREGLMDLKPSWQVPQIFDWAAYGGTYVEKSKAPPTLFELRSMAWQAIVGGANGLVFFSFGRLHAEVNGHTFEDRWRDVCAMGEEIRRYVPAMLSVEPAAKAVPSDARSIAVRTWSFGGRTYALAVNVSMKPFSGRISFDRRFRSAETGFGPFGRLVRPDALEVGLAPCEPAMYILK